VDQIFGFTARGLIARYFADLVGRRLLAAISFPSIVERAFAFPIGDGFCFMRAAISFAKASGRFGTSRSNSLFAA
jgi:hypothetical protein